MHRITSILASAAALVCLSTAAYGNISYNFFTFNGPGDNGGGTTANAISNTGSIVGFSSNANMTILTNFVRNPNGGFTALNINNDPLANANGINSAGQVVGTSNGLAFVYNNGLTTFLAQADPGNTMSETAFGINDGNAIVGQFVDTNTGTTPGFAYKNGQFTILSPVANADQVFAQSINDRGLVAGFYNTDGQHDHGFLFNTLTNQYTLLADPAVPNLFLTQFLGINDNGMAVGYYQDVNGDQHGFLYNLTTGQYTFLDDPNIAKGGLQITQITGINDSNELTGFYVNNAGMQQGFYATVTPEPGYMAVTALGLAGFIWFRRRRV